MVLKKIIPLVILIVCTFGAIATLIYAFKNIANWLYQKDPLPDTLDVICTFEGDHNREKYALELYKKYNPIWIASTYEKEWFERWTEKNGVEKSRLILKTGCMSTWEEIIVFTEKLSELQQKKIIKQNATIGFVSSFYHMRRIMVVSFLTKKPPQLKLVALPVPLEFYSLTVLDVESWWRNRKLRKIICNELVKMFGDVVSTIPLIGVWVRKMFDK